MKWIAWKLVRTTQLLSLDCVPCICLLLGDFKAGFDLFWDHPKCEEGSPCKASTKAEPPCQGGSYPICWISSGDRGSRLGRFLLLAFNWCCRWWLRGCYTQRWSWRLRLWRWSRWGRRRGRLRRREVGSSCEWVVNKWWRSKESSHFQDWRDS